MDFSFGRSTFILLSLGVMKRSWKRRCSGNQLVVLEQTKDFVVLWVKRKIPTFKGSRSWPVLFPTAFCSVWRRFFWKNWHDMKSLTLPSSVLHIWLRPKLMFDSGSSVQTRQERHHVPAGSTNLVITTWLWNPFHWVNPLKLRIYENICWHGVGLVLSFVCFLLTSN